MPKIASPVKQSTVAVELKVLTLRQNIARQIIPIFGITQDQAERMEVFGWIAASWADDASFVLIQVGESLFLLATSMRCFRWINGELWFSRSCKFNASSLVPQIFIA